MSSHLVAVTFDAPDPAGLASFWGHLLGRAVVEEARGMLLPGDATQVGLRFVAAPADTPGPQRLHLHLTSTSSMDQQQTVERTLSLGGRHLDVGQLPDEDHIVLADPGGNAFCVIEAGNDFLADCGRLGEVACDGTRAVGVFWQGCLDWPLVWDQHEETAIQSVHGGTKIAWGGPPLKPRVSRNRQRFDLATDDLDAEVARLVSLGATPRGDRDGGAELADPDGNEFWVGPAPVPPGA